MVVVECVGDNLGLRPAAHRGNGHAAAPVPRHYDPPGREFKVVRAIRVIKVFREFKVIRVIRDVKDLNLIY
jgi:hypothetical protein